MNTGTLLASRYDTAVDGLHFTLALYRNSGDRFEWACTCPEAPEAGYREVATPEDASVFLMDPATILNPPGNSTNKALAVDLGAVFTPAQIAKRWSVGQASVRTVIASGELPAFRAGSRLLRVRVEDVEAYESRHIEVKREQVSEGAERVKRLDAVLSEMRISRMKGPRTKKRPN